MKPIATISWTEKDVERTVRIWTTDQYRRIAWTLHNEKIAYVTCWMDMHTPIPRMALKNGDEWRCLDEIM